jgi:glycine cleavage system H lipoate-binding protein
MVDMMEMMNNVVDKQGWFVSIKMDQESDHTATHMHQQQQQRLKENF